jgi:hypothetical protein
MTSLTALQTPLLSQGLNAAAIEVAVEGATGDEAGAAMTTGEDAADTMRMEAAAGEAEAATTKDIEVEAEEAMTMADGEIEEEMMRGIEVEAEAMAIATSTLTL